MRRNRRGMGMAFVLLLLPSVVVAQSAVTSGTTAASAGDVTRADHGDAGALFNRPGLYVYVPEPDQRSVIETAVNRAVAHMFPIVRSLARQRLMATNFLPDTLRLLIGPDTLGAQRSREKPMTLPRSGDTVVWEDGRGNVCRASATVAADTLFERCKVGTAASVARYVLVDEGRMLWMIMHITSPRLTGPVDYLVAFRRLE